VSQSQKGQGVILVYALKGGEKVKVAVNAYAVVKNDLLIERKAKFFSRLNLVTMEDRMAG